MSNYRRARRCRWTVQFDSGQKVVILAYSLDDARDYYESRGKTIVKIVKGDFRAKVPASAPTTRQRFVIDNAMVEEARDLLGIKLPVKIRLHARRGPTNGNHCMRPDGYGYHDIMIKRYLRPEEANHTLWHELKHAVQAESHGYTGWVTFCKEQNKYPYDQREIEIEANEMADSMQDIKLVKEA